jgi:GntR family transcriptional regulator, histidine utilization repressor
VEVVGLKDRLGSFGAELVGKREGTITSQIRGDVESHIVSGKWPPGTRIPFEHELMERYACSRMTASKAILELVQAGLVERRRRAGTFVAEHELESFVLEIPDIQAVVKRSGEAYAFDVLTHRRRKPLAGKQHEKMLVGRGELVEVRGIHRAASRPFALEERYINLIVVPAAANANFAATPPGGWLLKHVPWSRAEQKIRAVGANPDEALLLQVAPGAPCLVVERQTWRNDVPVTYVRTLFPGDRYHLVGHFTPGIHKRVRVGTGSTRKPSRLKITSK